MIIAQKNVNIIELFSLLVQSYSTIINVETQNIHKNLSTKKKLIIYSNIQTRLSIFRENKKMHIISVEYNIKISLIKYILKFMNPN